MSIYTKVAYREACLCHARLRPLFSVGGQLLFLEGKEAGGIKSVNA